jgi:pyridoxal phosphate enzyme (YggS family)
MLVKQSFAWEIVLLFMSLFGVQVISFVKASVKPVVLRNKWIRMSSDLAATVVNNANVVQQRVEQAASKSSRDLSTVRLVAVSKTKPIEAIKALYDAGYRHFGENYFQELTEKAPQLPNDIKWHFIGHLQSSKSNKLVRDVPNLYMLETIDSEKLANKLQNACALANRETPLIVLIQVDTSNEDTKSGVTQEELLPLVDYINKECPLLKLGGMMTIGAPGDLTCFDKLVQSREHVAQHMQVPAESLELSMGMSGDFEEAIARGATSVRVGSTIFGERIYPNKQ